MIFSNNGYVIIKEEGTGIGGFELLVDPVSQTAYPEHRPNMMGNLKYSRFNHQFMIGGNGNSIVGRMMGGYSNLALTPDASVRCARLG